MTSGTVSSLLIASDTPLSAAASVVRGSGVRIAFVVDPDRRLLGSLTDGDIRRALLRGVDMSAPAADAMNPNPRTASVEQPRAALHAVMRASAVFQLPLLDEAGRVVDVALLSEAARSASLPNRVLLMAGGLGSRLGELTKSLPKPMLLVGGRPLLQSIVERFIAAGFRRFFISVNYLAEQIEQHFLDGSPLGVEIDYLRETKRLGTAGCLALMPERPFEPMFVMNGDILTDFDARAMLSFHRETGATATIAINGYRSHVPYGVVDVDGHRVTAIREKPSLSVFVSAGIYVLSPAALALVDADEPLDMPTLLERVMAQGGVVSAFPLHEYWLDIGRPDDLDAANDAYTAVFDDEARRAGSSDVRAEP